MIATLPEPRRLSRAVHRLRSEGMRHRRLLDAVRREIAERHLTVTGKTVGEVAFLLGYADPSAFSKAFRRWTGTPPGPYRRRARLVPTG